MSVTSRLSLDHTRGVSDLHNYLHITLDNGLEVLLISSLEILKDSSSSSSSELFKSSAALLVEVGSFSDPEDAQGCAHFLEHMLFMGTEKYPDENYYNTFVTKNGGSCNAYTEYDFTCYQFDINSDKFFEGLDIFSSCFQAPLLKGEAIERELDSIESEYKIALINDNLRNFQLLSTQIRDYFPSNIQSLFPQYYFLNLKKNESGNQMSLPKVTENSLIHPLKKFSWGNYTSLKSNKDIYKRLKSFYAQHYVPGAMKLVLHSPHTLVEMEEAVLNCFNNWTENQKARQEIFLKERELINKEIEKSPLASLMSYSPSLLSNDHFKNTAPLIMRTKNISNKHLITFTFTYPSIFYKDANKNSSALSYISHLIGHESYGSLLNVLKEKNLAYSLMAGSSCNYELNQFLSFFNVQIQLTNKGLRNWPQVYNYLVNYINFLIEKKPQEWVYEEVKNMNRLNFLYPEFDNPYDEAEKFVTFMAYYHRVPKENLIPKTSGVLDENFDSDRILELFKYFTDFKNIKIVLSSPLFDEEENSQEISDQVKKEYKRLKDIILDLDLEDSDVENVEKKPKISEYERENEEMSISESESSEGSEGDSDEGNEENDESEEDEEESEDEEEDSEGENEENSKESLDDIVPLFNLSSHLLKYCEIRDLNLESKTEPFFNIKYTEQFLDEDFYEFILTPCTSIFSLPPQNYFIPTDFTLLSEDKESPKVPKLSNNDLDISTNFSIFTRTKTEKFYNIENIDFKKFINSDYESYPNINFLPLPSLISSTRVYKIDEENKTFTISSSSYEDTDAIKLYESEWESETEVYEENSDFTLKTNNEIGSNSDSDDQEISNPSAAAITHILYHNFTTSFKQPKVFFNYNFFSLLKNFSVSHHIFNILIWKLARDSINELIYIGEMASIDFTFKENLIFTFSGYSDKISNFIIKVFEVIFSGKFLTYNSNSNDPQDVLKRKAFKRNLRKKYLNILVNYHDELKNKMLKSSKICTEIRISYLKDDYDYSPYFLLQELDSNLSYYKSLKNIKRHYYQIISSLFSVSYIQGNITHENAVKINEKVLNILNKNSLHNFQFSFNNNDKEKLIKDYVTKNKILIEYKNNIKQLKNFSIYRITDLQTLFYPKTRLLDQNSDIRVVHLKTSNSKEKNSTVDLYFQIVPYNNLDYISLSLLELILDNDFFNELRTKKQLGYSVSCSLRLTNGYLGYHFNVVSSLYTYEDLLENIFSYINERILKLSSWFSLSDFEELKKTFFKSKLEQKNSLVSLASEILYNIEFEFPNFYTNPVLAQLVNNNAEEVQGMFNNSNKYNSNNPRENIFDYEKFISFVTFAFQSNPFVLFLSSAKSISDSDSIKANITKKIHLFKKFPVKFVDFTTLNNENENKNFFYCIDN